LIGFSEPTVNAGVAELSAAFAERSARPDIVLDLYLDRIERLNPRLGAFVDLDIDGAHQAARASTVRWASAMPLSPVDGCVVGVKANIAVEGLPWTAGIGAYRDRIAGEDAACVRRLRRAGVVIVGTLNMDEGALGAVTDNPWFGRTQNPWHEGYTAGGSSGGSGAAVSAGLCAAALGTDTMGSVRIPSAYCGVFGIKPGFGAVPAVGVTPLSPSLDHIGVHARSAADCALILTVMADPEPSASIGPLAILDVNGRADLTDDTRNAFAALAARAGSEGLVQGAVALDIDLGRLRRRGLLISEVEGMAEHAAGMAERAEGFSPAFSALLHWGAAQSPEKVAQARTEIAAAKARIETLLGDRTGLLCPTTGGSALAFGQPIPADQADLTCLANMAGLPAVAFPMGLTRDGLPLSAQIIGWRSSDILALAGRLAAPVRAPIP